MLSAPGSPAGGSNRVIAGRYRVVRPIGRGGMGTVYEVEHLVTLKRLAVKLLFPAVAEMPGFRERFVREARARSGIGHEGIVDVLDAGSDEDGNLYLAMELLEGESLRAYARRPDTTRLDVLSRIADLTEPLCAAHLRGYVHRDLKPENVFVVRDGSTNERVKPLDFGIARDARDSAITRTGSFLGTLRYVSPEQARAPRDAAPTADVWSVGILCYEALTGRTPFESDGMNAVQRASSEPHADLRVIDATIPEALAALVDDCLAKVASERPANAGLVGARLREILSDEQARAALTTSVPQPTVDVAPSHVESTKHLDPDVSGGPVGARAMATAVLESGDIAWVDGPETEVIDTPEPSSEDATLLFDETTAEATTGAVQTAVTTPAGMAVSRPAAPARTAPVSRRLMYVSALIAVSAIGVGLAIGWMVSSEGEPAEATTSPPPVPAPTPVLQESGSRPAPSSSEPMRTDAPAPPASPRPQTDDETARRGARRPDSHRDSPASAMHRPRTSPPEVRYGSNRAPIVQ